MPEPKRLDINSQVSPEELEQLQMLEDAKVGIAERNLFLDLEKIRLLASARRVDEQCQEVMRKILVDRGLPADEVVHISKSGRITRAVPEPSVPPIEPDPVEP